MVLSSHAALNKVQAGGMRELNDYITQSLDNSINAANVVKPEGLHFVVADKVFRGTKNKFWCCPITFLLRDGSGETMLCQPMWTVDFPRAKMNRKVKVATKKFSVIRLDDFKVTPHEPSPSGYVFFILGYSVVKKDVEEDAYRRWILE
jgi:hypothetical protein